MVLSAISTGVTATAAGFFVKPVRELSTSGKRALYYDSTSGEISYDDGDRRLLAESPEESDDLVAHLRALEAQIQAQEARIQALEAQFAL